MPVRSRRETAWQKGPPGWIVAVAITANVLVSWHLGALGIAGYMAMWEVAGGVLATWSGSAVGLWLAYRAYRSSRPRYESNYSENPFDETFVPRS